MDEYLRRFARQHASANVSRTYVAAEGAEVRGFYSLAMSAIRKDNLPISFAVRFPNFPLPVARLARLAVAIRHQRKGLGELLLADVLQRCLRLSSEIGMIGVIVDAKDERARQWYKRYEFERLPDSPFTLWLPTAAIEKL
ncbi:MAG: GNAT family N-acetyltransferase [Rhodocyclaceae bacterium]|nr:GNAT family N-acetyltransferase [Rhodocyclaceae bacterium]MDZ4215099.1 GNAT family N-acetyltransferase [Rhodocyclaceae bacterium]